MRVIGVAGSCWIRTHASACVRGRHTCVHVGHTIIPGRSTNQYVDTSIKIIDLCVKDNRVPIRLSDHIERDMHFICHVYTLEHGLSSDTIGRHTI